MRLRVLACTLWVSILGASQEFEGGAAEKGPLAIYAIGASPSRRLAATRLLGETGIKPGRHLQALDWQEWEASAYSHNCTLSLGGERPAQRGANGEWPVPNLTVAADPSILFGTRLLISYDGIITERIVGDRGRAIRGKKLDLFVSSCFAARTWGRRMVSVKILSVKIPKEKP